jgi:hypothetical protein
MTDHMCRLLIEPPKGEAETAVDNWVQNHTEWTDDPVEHAMTETTAGINGDGTECVRGDYRFVQEEPADELLTGLEERLQGFQGGLWYRIGYHACTHDESDPQPCEWEDVREGGDVPSDIPTF